ncbi:hypothetical protein GWI33_009174 [Rhynchophorus ferrugineus]|uniref:Uncharacterized protein n=1 Tax=Rhynchophorus ferrugineus TaxID=354439 RepID=A0A834MAF3_RHYFE|nr:hypothetical protein GWI33_009174 [Rhynchophorus ferrugineus]
MVNVFLIICQHFSGEKRDVHIYHSRQRTHSSSSKIERPWRNKFRQAREQGTSTEKPGSRPVSSRLESHAYPIAPCSSPTIFP